RRVEADHLAAPEAARGGRGCVADHRRAHPPAVAPPRDARPYGPVDRGATCSLGAPVRCRQRIFGGAKGTGVTERRYPVLRQSRARATEPLILIGVAAACWAVTTIRMQGMDMMSRTDLGALGD